MPRGKYDRSKMKQRRNNDAAPGTTVAATPPVPEQRAKRKYTRRSPYWLGKEAAPHTAPPTPRSSSSSGHAPVVGDAKSNMQFLVEYVEKLASLRSGSDPTSELGSKVTSEIAKVLELLKHERERLFPSETAIPVTAAVVSKPQAVSIPVPFNPPMNPQAQSQ